MYKKLAKFQRLEKKITVYNNSMTQWKTLLEKAMFEASASRDKLNQLGEQQDAMKATAAQYDELLKELGGPEGVRELLEAPDDEEG